MNNIKATKAINEKELHLGIKASWHDDYKNSAYVYIGGLDPALTEGDIITIFSQYGEPVDINLPKEKAPAASADKSSRPSTSSDSQKSKSRGFCFLMYENQLSTNLAVDNLNGAVVLGRTLRVDHCKNYKQLERNQDGKVVERDADLGERLNARPELHLQSQSHQDDRSPHSDGEDSIDPEDPMAAYILAERRKKKLRENHNHNPRHDSREHDSRKHKKKRGPETEAERSARKDAKRLKKLLKEVGPSNSREDDGRRDRDRYEARDGEKYRRPDRNRWKRS